MGAKFDSEIITLGIGDSLMETLKGALERNGKIERLTGASAIFIIDDVTIQEINGHEVKCEVEYEY